MRKRKRSPIEEFESLSAEEKERQYRELDHEFAKAQTKPLTPEQRKAWKKRQERRRARATGVSPSTTVSLRIASDLLQRADALGKRNGLSRAEVVARGLELLLAS